MAGINLGAANSGNLAASAVVSAVASLLTSVVVAGGSDACVCTLYDNASAGSGTVLATIKVPTVQTIVFAPPIPIVCANGIYATISGTTPAIVVHYQKL